MKHILLSIHFKFRVLLWIFLTVFLALFLFYSVLSFRSEALIVSTLKSLSGKEAYVKRVNIYFPATLALEDLRVGNIFALKKADISLNIFSLLFGRIVFSDINIVEPKLQFVLNRSLPESISAGFAPVSGSAQEHSVKEEPLNGESRKSARKAASVESVLLPPFGIDRLRVRGGEVILTDRNLGPGEEVKLIFKDIRIKVENLSFIKKFSLTRFDVSTVMPWGSNNKSGRLKFSGWMDFVKMDMAADLDIKDIDGVYFKPYYSTWIDLDSAKIKEASLNFKSAIKGHNDDISAKCSLELADIKFFSKQETGDSGKNERMAAAVINAFRSVDQGKILLNFTLHTKMHKPQLGVQYINSAVREKLSDGFKTRLGPEDLVILPVKFLGAVVKGMVKGTAGVSKTFVEGTIGVGKEVKDAVKDRIVDKAAAKVLSEASVKPEVASGAAVSSAAGVPERPVVLPQPASAAETAGPVPAREVENSGAAN